MNTTLLKALIAFVPVAALFVYALAAFNRQRTTWSALLAVAALCFVIVVLTHIAEALRLFPAMGWGDPHSIGHYIDLTSAVGGIVFVATGVVLRIRSNVA